MLRMMLAAAALVMTASASEAAQSFEAAYRVALKKGYSGEKAKCYAQVSMRYYKPGTFTVSSRSAHSWHIDLWNQCRISR